jgi:ATP-dependent helicase/nuclease subunit B
MLIEGKKACYDIYSTVKGSQFKPTYFEVRFGKGNEKEAISLNTKSGNYKIKGAIDRVDFAGDKVRVIDYKSGKTHPEVEAFYTGNNLQLYLYMNAFTREGYKPAGAYYFPIKNDYVNEDKARKYIMDGNTVDSEEVLKASDGNLLPNTQSALIHVKLKTNGEPNKGSSAVLTEKQMQAYLDYSLKIAAKGVDEINEGYVKAKPYKPDVNCKYCKYAGLCNTVICETDGRKVSKVTPEDIVLAVEYENDLELSSKENNDGIN